MRITKRFRKRRESWRWNYRTFWLDKRISEFSLMLMDDDEVKCVAVVEWTSRLGELRLRN